MKRKVLLILLALLCALMLTACFNEDTPPKTDDPSFPSDSDNDNEDSSENNGEKDNGDNSENSGENDNEDDSENENESNDKDNSGDEDGDGEKTESPEHTHTLEVLPEIPATCTENGLTAGNRCSECEEITVKQEVIEALGHDEIPHDAKVSCTEIGWAAYVTCSRCEYTTYNEIQALEHSMSTWYELNSTTERRDCERTNCDYFETRTVTPLPVDDYTRDGDYIYFGSWPQSAVTDSNLKSTLTSLAGTLPTSINRHSWTSYEYYIGGNNSTDFMWYIDVTHNGEKYRGVYFDQYRPHYTNDTLYNYQDDNGYIKSTVYWFKWETLKWRILTEKSGKALLLCEMLIDSQQYDTSSNNYNNSDIRAWMLNTFYKQAFTDLQKQIILKENVDNSATSTGYTNNPYICEDTYDEVFLLSYKEVTNSDYGFSDDYSDYDEARQKQTTAYAQCQGAFTFNGGIYDGNGWWWLRSPNYDYSYYSRVVLISGSADDNDLDYYTYYGVCPALWIEL